MFLVQLRPVLADDDGDRAGFWHLHPEEDVLVRGGATLVGAVGRDLALKGLVQVAALLPLCELPREGNERGVCHAAVDDVVVDARETLAGVAVRQTKQLELVETGLGELEHEDDLVVLGLLEHVVGVVLAVLGVEELGRHAARLAAVQLQRKLSLVHLDVGVAVAVHRETQLIECRLRPQITGRELGHRCSLHLCLLADHQVLPDVEEGVAVFSGVVGVDL